MAHHNKLVPWVSYEATKEFTSWMSVYETVKNRLSIYVLSDRSDEYLLCFDHKDSSNAFMLATRSQLHLTRHSTLKLTISSIWVLLKTLVSLPMCLRAKIIRNMNMQVFLPYITYNISVKIMFVLFVHISRITRDVTQNV